MIFQWNEIKQGDIKCVTSDKFEVNTSTGKNQIHVPTLAPKSNAKENTFRIKNNEPSMMSNIILTNQTDKKTGLPTVSLKTHLEVFGNYAIKDDKGEHTKDDYGKKLIESYSKLDSYIAKEIDNDPALKRKIIASFKATNFNELLGKPMIDHMIPSVKTYYIEDDKSEFVGNVDESKTPTIPYAYWIGQAKDDNPSALRIPGTNQVLFTKVYDHTKGITKTPIKDWKDLEKFIYTKGDSKTKGIRPFRLNSTFETLPPTVYGTEEAKKCRLKFKLTEHHIFGVDYSKGGDELSEDSVRELQAQMMKAQSKYVINSEIPNTIQQQHQHSYDADDESQNQFHHTGDKRKIDQITNPHNTPEDGDDIGCIDNDSPTSHHDKRFKSNGIQNSEYYDQYRRDLYEAINHL